VSEELTKIVKNNRGIISKMLTTRAVKTVEELAKELPKELSESPSEELPMELPEELLKELPEEQPKKLLEELRNWIIGVIRSEVGVKGMVEESKREKKPSVEVEHANP
jgi:putative heme iron utilization protein